MTLPHGRRSLDSYRLCATLKKNLALNLHSSRVKYFIPPYILIEKEIPALKFRDKISLLVQWIELFIKRTKYCKYNPC